MTPAITSEPIPLAVDADGVFRVGGSRVTLDTVIGAYKQGDTPEQIAQDYSSLEPADIYAVIAYYLRNRAEVEAYLEQRRAQADEVRRKFKEIFPTDGLRERLEKRLRERGD